MQPPRLSLTNNVAPLRSGSSIAGKAFFMMSLAVIVLFGTIYLTMQTQNKTMAQEQNTHEVQSAARESFRTLEQKFNDKESLSKATLENPYTAQSHTQLAWVRSDTTGALSIINKTEQPPCLDVIALVNRFNQTDSVTQNQQGFNVCKDLNVLAVLHPAYISDGSSRISVVAWYDGISNSNRITEEFTQEFGAMFVIGIILCLLASRAISVSLSTPIRHLAQVTNDIADGNYTVDLPTDRSDELGLLARAFNKMVRAVKEREHNIRQLAYFDELTGLYNRAYFLEVLQNRIEQSNQKILVAVWDIREYPNIHEALGFSVADSVLVTLSQRFKSDLKDLLVLSRLSEQTFAIITPDILKDTPQTLAKTIFQSVGKSICVDTQSFDISATIGLSEYPTHGIMPEVLLRRAEMARRHASKSRCNWLMFTPGLETPSTLGLSILSELTIALQTNNQLQLYLQPKISVVTGRIDSVEALIRWHHPTRGLIPPFSFIPLAEQTGRIVDITAWAIPTGLSLMSRCGSIGPLKISINVSALDLEQEDFAENVIQCLAQTNTAPDTLYLEITESAAMNNPERALNTLLKLHRAGVGLSIDDFGSGYSSLSYLKRFPVQELKIDRSLVAGIRPGSDGEVILRSTIELGHSMGLSVTAEGVETVDEYDLLSNLGIDHIQGYLIGKPMPFDAFQHFMQSKTTFTPTSSPN